MSDVGHTSTTTTQTAKTQIPILSGENMPIWEHKQSSSVILSYTPLVRLKTLNQKRRRCLEMAEEGKMYVCEMCGAEVKVIKKTVPDPKCPTLTCCGKEMKEKTEKEGEKI
ncbi:MAG: hypothetical protein ACE5K2_01215 [Candidatus Zixiibacteriota bacterium]